MKHVSDDALDKMLRDCGSEMRLASHQLIESGLAEHREDSVRRAVLAAREPASFWSILFRPYLWGSVLPRRAEVISQLALVTALVLTLTYSLRMVPGARIAVDTDLAGPEDPLDADVSEAYRLLSASLDGEGEEENEASPDKVYTADDEERIEDLGLDYYSLSIDSAQETEDDTYDELDENAV